MRRSRLWCVLVLAASQAIPAPAQTPTPLRPAGIAYDSAGNLYIADSARNQIYESTLGGVLSVIAGTGAQGFAGDGGPASSALLNRPSAIVIASDGTIYITDTGNQRIRSLSSKGVISTFAGNGIKGFAGDGASAATAELCEPRGLAFASDGSLLIADTCNQRIRSVHSGVISTAAGSGVEGFGGDGAAAISAELDAPSAVAVDSAGKVYIADARNHRVRVIRLDGTIATLAGNGTRGFAGDGAAATAAELSWPSGVAAMADGSVLIADADNQRIRSVSPTGVISTLAGTGIEGTSADGTAAIAASLNELRGMAVSSFGVPVFADAAASAVKGRLSDSGLYNAAGLSFRSSAVTMTLPAASVYGTPAATVRVVGSAATPAGQVQLLEGLALVSQGALNSGTAAMTAPALGVGSHTLMASYSGDGFNPSAVSAAGSIAVTPVSVTAQANPATVFYGQGLPGFTGTETGILAQDQAVESVAFTSAAGLLSPAGQYPISAALQGPSTANYTLSLTANSGALTIAPASTSISVTANTGYAGLPITLQANVAPAYTGAPTGTVTFSENNATVATASVANGVATGIYLSPGTGTHTITAQYSGDTNFLPSASSPLTATIASLPDFGISVQGSSTQLVSAGSLATYTLTLQPTSSAFSSAVSLGVSGLPTSTTVILSPSLVIPSTAGTTVTVTVPTAGLISLQTTTHSPVEWAWFPVGLLVLLSMRRRRCVLAALSLLLFAAGCGARKVPESLTAPKSFTVHVTGTATSLAGTPLTHSVDLFLTLQ